MTKHTEMLKEDEVAGMRTILTPEKVDFIVQACNHYEPLLGALKAIVTLPYIKYDLTDTGGKAVLKQAKQLLTQLEKDGE